MLSRDEASSWSESELLLYVLDKRAGALRELLRRYHKLVRQCIRRVMSNFSAVLASADQDDVYANFLCHLCSNDMRALRMFEAGRGAKLGTWLGLLARNAAHDFLRRVARAPALQKFDASFDEASYEDDPSEALDRRVQFGRLMSTYKKLPPQDQKFIVLYYHQQQSPAEVAAAMSISVKTVYTKKHKLESRLTSTLRPE
jgi:RNA polymerase sigma-70 factor, ECF subfamily